MYRCQECKCSNWTDLKVTMGEKELVIGEKIIKESTGIELVALTCCDCGNELLIGLRAET